MSQRVLVVEDQEDLRAILRYTLEGAGYEVVEAANGAEGVARAEAERPDLVLMDIQMPILDGYEATRRIKALPGMAATPVIAVSSFAMKGDEEKARASGCDDYVTKPYSPKKLLALVQKLLLTALAKSENRRGVGIRGVSWLQEQHGQSNSRFRFDGECLNSCFSTGLFPEPLDGRVCKWLNVAKLVLESHP